VPLYKVPISSCVRSCLADSELDVEPAWSEGVLRVHYLGVGGFVLERCLGTWEKCNRRDVVLTAPLYSNPSLIEVLMDHQIRPDVELIDALLPEAADHALAILVGHSHYDHLMDVPWVAAQRADKAVILGSQSTQELLGFDTNVKSRVQAIDTGAYDPKRNGTAKWHYFPERQDPRVRVLAIRSQHSDQIALDALGLHLPLHLARGEAVPGANDRWSPRAASDWAEGTVLAYLVDFLNSECRLGALDRCKVDFRIYYQDSGANAGFGAPPPDELRAKRTDVALLCAGGEYRRLDDHPGFILNRLKPRFIVAGHWEDFFSTQRAYCVPDSKDRAVVGQASSPTFLGVGRSHTEGFLDGIEMALRSFQEQDRPLDVWLPCPTLSVFDVPPQSADASACRHVRGEWQCHYETTQLCPGYLGPSVDDVGLGCLKAPCR
jgi:hypothetical protein